MEGDGVAVVEAVDEAEVDVALDILGILGVENLVGAAMLVLTDDFGDGVEEVAGRLDGGSESPDVGFEDARGESVERLGSAVGEVCLLYTSPSPRD